jgi:hypothetical protein
MDPDLVTLAPGMYRVYATLGPEFSLTQTKLEVGVGETVDLVIEPPTRVLETPGWISSDFHVHSAPSLDSPLRNDTRVASFVAQGGEVLIASEHDVLYDYEPLIAELGLRHRLTSLIGLEVTSEVSTELAPHTIGHANAFPMIFERFAFRRGAVPDEGRRWREIIADLRALPGERVVQLNHARGDGEGIVREAFLTHMGPAKAPYDRERPLTDAPNRVLIEPDPETGLRDIDFDAIELLNGKRMAAYSRLREDWFSLLLQGERLTGTANSDSHFLHSVVAAPRNYVRVVDDNVERLDTEAFVRSVRRGQSYGTTGPLLQVKLGDAEMGDTFRGREGRLEVRVSAAPWIDVSKVRVFVNGIEVYAGKASTEALVQVPLRFEADAFVVVEVQGEPDEGYRAVLPGFTPFAFSNPIYVDADADGAWTPPGLPSRG